MEVEIESTEKVIGKYKILQEIGKGTYGEVYKALHVDTKEIVALKKTITRVEYYWLGKMCYKIFQSSLVVSKWWHTKLSPQRNLSTQGDQSWKCSYVRKLDFIINKWPAI